MKRDYSLKGKTVFQEVFKRGHRLQRNGIQIIFLNKDELHITEERFSAINDGRIKIGITMSKKIGKAFIRNRVKRRIKSICSELVPLCKHTYCIVIRSEKKSMLLSYQEQKEIIRLLFNKAGITG